jgi:hypothetical protein
VTAENQSFSAVQKLDASHEVDAFDCGKEPLDRFLQRHALVNQKAGSAQTYVVCRREQRVAGYYSLAVGAVEHADAPGRVGKGLARHPIPVMLLARLAIDRAEQGKGLGKHCSRMHCCARLKLPKLQVSERFSFMPRTMKRAPGTSSSTSSRVRPTPIISSC